MPVSTWEVIIVGGGSAGAVLAARLSEARDRRVLLLEAGRDWRSDGLDDRLRRPWQHDGWDIGPRTPVEYLWPDLVARGSAAEQPERYLAGRGLGGSSTINSCYALRPPLSEFSQWLQRGCIGWGPDDVLPYFKRLEDDRDFADDPVHGSGGPLSVVRLPEDDWGTSDLALKQAALAAGHAWVPDHNGVVATGVSPFAANIRDGERITTNDVYLEPVRRRDNLEILGDALVDRVLLSAKRAIGVRVCVGGVWQEIRGDEVILAAGAASSPAILQRSGIGPASKLRDVGVTVLEDLPVGQALQDHAGFGLVRSAPHSRTPLTGVRSNCILRFSSDLAGAGEADLHIASANPPADGERVVVMVCSVSQAFSRGSLTITSADPTASPQIDLGLLTDERDRVRARHLMRYALSLLGGPGYEHCRGEIVDEHSQAVRADMTDGDLDSRIRRAAHHTSHIACTAPMGLETDPFSVVDSHCRVLGVDGLRVADASIFPEVTRANTNLTAIMVGERLSGMLAQ